MSMINKNYVPETERVFLCVCMMYHALSMGGETITALVTFTFGKFSLVRIYSKLNISYPYLYTWSM